MVTGFTWKLYEGDDETFSGFVLRCARGLSECLHQKDEPLDEPPRLREIDENGLDEIIAAVDRLKMLTTMSCEESTVAARREYVAALDRHIDEEWTTYERICRYEDMLKMVLEWEPPTRGHSHLKEFMIDQLVGSIEDYGNYWRFIPPTLSGESWRRQQIGAALLDIRDYAVWHKEHINRVKRDNAWITALYESLDRED